MGRVTNKTELAVFLLMVVREMKVGAVDMWDTSLTVEDRLTALRFDNIIQFIIFCQAPAPTRAELCWDFKQMSNLSNLINQLIIFSSNKGHLYNLGDINHSKKFPISNFSQIR